MAKAMPAVLYVFILELLSELNKLRGTRIFIDILVLKTEENKEILQADFSPIDFYE